MHPDPVSSKSLDSDSLNTDPKKFSHVACTVNVSLVAQVQRKKSTWNMYCEGRLSLSYRQRG
jgi:hypothetical protein